VTYICFVSDNICPLILKRHLYTFCISCICRLIFNAHINVTYHKKTCRLQTTTSHHTILGFPILARVPAQNFSNFQFIHMTLCVCSFRMALLVKIFTCVTHSKSETLEGTGSLGRVTIFPIWLKIGLCADTGYVQHASLLII